MLKLIYHCLIIIFFFYLSFLDIYFFLIIRIHEKSSLCLPGLAGEIKVPGGPGEISAPATPGEPLSQLHHKNKVRMVTPYLPPPH